MKIIKDEIATTKPTKTEGKPDVVVLLDASGSMSSHRESVVSTFNEYVQSVKDSANTISLYTFDSDGIREKIYKQSPARIPKLTTKDYIPSAMTPLYDAMGIVLQKFEDSTRNVQFVTHTDGVENASKEFNFESITSFIKKLTDRGWLFVYLGEGIQGKQEMNKFAGVKLQFSSGNRFDAIRGLSQTTALYSCGAGNDTLAYSKTADGSIDVDAGDGVVGLAKFVVQSAKVTTTN